MLSLLLQLLIVSLAINIAMFLIAYRLQSDKLTDISYAISFVALGAVGYFRASGPTAYRSVLFALVALWAIRLGYFLLVRVRKAQKDRRFDNIRSNFMAFARFWIAQAITVWLLMIPAELALHNGGTVTYLAILGIAAWAIGLLIEGVADRQKFNFKLGKENKGKWIDEGLWKFSRHPNYFGEMLIWASVYLYTFDALSGWEKLVGLISPVFIIVLLRFVSGVPILEKAADERWGTLPEYQAYKARTRLLLPLPRRSKSRS